MENEFNYLLLSLFLVAFLTWDKLLILFRKFNHSFQGKVLKSNQEFACFKSNFEKLMKDDNEYRYYEQLSPVLKKRFLQRMSFLLNRKKIVGEEDFVVTDEVRHKVIAAFVQLTFGFEEYELPRFHTIVVYPDVFYSELTDAWFRGSVENHGIIRLSWTHFEAGFNSKEDQMNLGFHELGHALLLEYENDGDYDPIFDEHFSEWREQANTEMWSMIHEKSSFFRDYAKTNLTEFLSICIEVFFEQPQLFHNNKPELFLSVSSLLNQSPILLEETGNPLLVREVRMYNFTNNQNILRCFVGFFISMPFVFALNSEIHIPNILVLFILICFTAFNIFRFRRKLILEEFGDFLPVILISALSFALPLMALLLIFLKLFLI